MSIFSSNGFLGHLWAGVKSLFVKVEEQFLPEAISITEAVNNAIKTGVVQDIIAAISPELDGIPAKVLTAAQDLVPKLLSAELGLEALKTGATPQDAIAWANSAISAFAGKTLTEQSGIWTNLATELVILFDQGKTADKTWIDWANTAEQAFQKIQAAIAAAKAAINPVAATAKPQTA